MIVTFYSYKGGTGRTMALANVAILLAREGKRVLAVDFDLEAPGIWRFFEDLEPDLHRRNGLLDMLTAHSAGQTVDWREYVSIVEFGAGVISVMTSGLLDADYPARVLDFNWRDFFTQSDGGAFMEKLRAEWSREFDFVLIDSRTGITDTGGVCTIALPDLIAPVFVPNHQSVEGILDVLRRAQEGRKNLAYDRPPALVLPVLSRFDSRTEYESANEWLDLLAEKLGHLYADWLPKNIGPRKILERSKLPYVAYFSFGEKLPALQDSLSDPESLGYALSIIARLIGSHLADAEAVASGSITSMPLRTAADATQTQAVQPTAKPAGEQVICPICLTTIEDWGTLKRWRWDADQDAYAELNIPADITGPQRASMERGSARRCPNPYQLKPAEHYLPADYGSFGPPVILGFVGLTRSGKTHLLAAMAGAMQAGLRQFGIDYRALDRSLHEQFLKNQVRPLLQNNEMLAGTQEGIVTFADAFFVMQRNGQQRPVVMFDVAGGELAAAAVTTKFLDIADGLFFLADPSQIESGAYDVTFSNVLDLLKGTGRLPGQVSAAIVLNKADLVRFEEPVTRWLRSGSGTLDANEFLSESRDVYAYLHSKGAAAWTLPYEEFAKATLHVASATGGVGEDGVYPRGVTPRRVLRPLVAMLAMTGVLTGAEAEKVGI